MLTDIFCYRYLKYPIWSTYGEPERRLLNQTIGIAKDIYPPFNQSGKAIDPNAVKWKVVHDQLARELGISELSQRYYSYTQKAASGNELPVSGFFGYDYVCGQFVTSMPPSGNASVDAFIKERVSFIELLMRMRENEVAVENSNFPAAVLEAQRRSQGPSSSMLIPGDPTAYVKSVNALINQTFQGQVDELNERFRRAGVPLTYHNGFIQVATDEVIEREIATPFWQLVSSPIWSNVGIDMAEALDRRDANDKDPAIFAAKALESAIKIVSDVKGLTRGVESGAAAYIDNLVGKANGAVLAIWEGDMLKDYFRKVRNSLGHGPGSEPMPSLTTAQTDWAIEAAMSWVRTLVRRT